MLTILKFGFPALLLMLSVAGADAAERVAVEEPSAVGARGIILAADKKIQRRQVQPRTQKRMMRARPRGNKGTFNCFCSGGSGACSAVLRDGTVSCEKSITGGCSAKCSIRIEFPGSKMRLKQ